MRVSACNNIIGVNLCSCDRTVARRVRLHAEEMVRAFSRFRTVVNKCMSFVLICRHEGFD